MHSQLVPSDFKVPEKLETPEFIIRKLCSSDAELDYKAVMSSIDIIKKTRGVIGIFWLKSCRRPNRIRVASA